MRLWAKMFNLLLGFDDWNFLGAIAVAPEDDAPAGMMEDPFGPPPPRP